MGSNERSERRFLWRRDQGSRDDKGQRHNDGAKEITDDVFQRQESFNCEELAKETEKSHNND